MPITEPVDEDELEADLAALEQENLDEKMLKTGTVPVADSLSRAPQAANGERESPSKLIELDMLVANSVFSRKFSQREDESAGGGRRRGRGVEEVAG